jgi:hypothetical protein
MGVERVIQFQKPPARCFVIVGAAHLPNTHHVLAVARLANGVHFDNTFLFSIGEMQTFAVCQRFAAWLSTGWLSVAWLGAGKWDIGNSSVSGRILRNDGAIRA